MHLRLIFAVFILLGACAHAAEDGLDPRKYEQYKQWPSDDAVRSGMAAIRQVVLIGLGMATVLML